MIELPRIKNDSKFNIVVPMYFIVDSREDILTNINNQPKLKVISKTKVAINKLIRLLPSTLAEDL